MDGPNILFTTHHLAIMKYMYVLCEIRAMSSNQNITIQFCYSNRDIIKNVNR